MDIIASAKKIPVAVLENSDCQGHISDDNKKYETIICNQFLSHMRKLIQAKNNRYSHVWSSF